MKASQALSATDLGEPRKCFLKPPPELHDAATLLDRAADALLASDRQTARSLILTADVPSIGDFAQLVAGRYREEIHRYREVPNSPPISRERVKQRMPGKTAQLALFERDGWRCRFCDTRLVAKGAIKRIVEDLPDGVRWGPRNSEKHFALSAMCGVIDHIVPHSRGGTTEDDNLVATCGPCNYGRNQWTLEEVGLEDPRLRPPVVDRWDGLTRLLR